MKELTKKERREKRVASVRRKNAAVTLQRTSRKFLTSRRKLYVNEDDPITLERITPRNSVSLLEDGRIYLFDKEILRYFFETGNFTNPFTRTAIPDSFLKKLAAKYRENFSVKLDSILGRECNFYININFDDIITKKRLVLTLHAKTKALRDEILAFQNELDRSMGELQERIVGPGSADVPFANLGNLYEDVDEDRGHVLDLIESVEEIERVAAFQMAERVLESLADCLQRVPLTHYKRLYLCRTTMDWFISKLIIL